MGSADEVRPRPAPEANPKATPRGAAPLVRADAGDGPSAEDAPPETGNQRLEDAQRLAEARFRSIVERSVDGVIVLDPDGRVRFANPAAEKLFGRSRQDLSGSDFGFPVVAGETTEIDILRGGADAVVAEMRVVETRWDDADALLVLIRDVTDRKAAEERRRALIRAEAARDEAEAAARRAELLDRVNRALGGTLDLDELLRALAGVIVEEVGDVCLVDIDDRYGPLRRVAAARRDYERRAVLKGLEDRPVRIAADTPEARVFRTGKSELVADVTPDWLDEAAEEDEQLNAFRQLRPCSLMMVTLQAGALPWGVVTILACEGGRRYGPADLALAEEVVRRAGMAVENARLYRLALEASRAKSDFLAIVSHELRTPLSAVVGYADLLLEEIGGPLNPTQKDYVGSCRRSAEHLIRLIEQVITFARLEGGYEHARAEVVDVGALAHDVVTLVRPLADRKGLTLTLEVPEAGAGADIESDGKKLSQILINLLTNAIKYTDQGEVRLEADVGELETVFRVRDTGPGIPADKRELIFEPFRQLEDPRTRREGGAGIGLSVVRNLTRLLGGEVGVDSQEGRGSTFIVRLPPRRPEEHAPA